MTDDDPEVAAYLEGLSPAARAFAEMGAGLRERLEPADPSGISPREVLERRMKRGPTALFTEKSFNRKLSPVEAYHRPGKRPGLRSRSPHCSSTFVSIAVTCPASCPFKDHGCFADAGVTGIRARQLDTHARGLATRQVIADECREIDRAYGGGRVPQDGMTGGRDLRLHVGGDAGDEEGARLLAGAAARFRERGGGSVWTFTHLWRTIPRAAFGAIAVLASVEDPADLAIARAAGYAPAIVLPELPANGKRFALEGSLVPVVPCPAESLEKSCVECRLCLDRDLLKMGVAIGFAAHGPTAIRARESLVQLRTPLREAQPGRKSVMCSRCGGKDHNARNPLCPGRLSGDERLFVRLATLPRFPRAPKAPRPPAATPRLSADPEIRAWLDGIDDVKEDGEIE